MGQIAVPSSGGSGTINITTNGTHDVKKYATANVNVKLAKVIGTYSSNASIDVSAYGASSVNEFIAVSSSSGAPSSYRNFSGSGGQISADFTPPSLSLSGNTLSITVGSVSAQANMNGTVWSTSGTVSATVYYIGKR